MQIDQLISFLKENKRNGLIVAFDGRCASGKTSAAQALSEYGYAAVHTDHFFLPPQMRTDERLKLPGGNIHIERFRQQVILPLLNDQDICYDIFDCSKMELSGKVSIKSGTPIIVEGAYSLHPELERYYDHGFFFDVSRDAQIKRITSRAPQKLNDFLTKWIPMEESYIEHYGIDRLKGIITVSTE